VTALTLIIICGSVWGLFQLLVVLVGWRFTKIRPHFDAVLQQRSDAIGEFDDHVDTALEILLTHEAGVADGAQPERWIELEEEFADLDDLAAQLGERTS
jgi:hypothetical protein